MKNYVMELVDNHRSIRRFLDKDIDNRLIDEIINYARQASSHHNIQAYSVIVVRDNHKKKVLSEVAADQEWIRTAPVFIVVCMDYYRMNKACEIHNTQLDVSDIESIMIGSIDSALVAQNIILMAESNGLGGVIIGGIRNNPQQIIEILNLPKLTFPLFGICLGYPDINQIPWKKPRLPSRISVFQESYNTELIVEGLEEYEEITSDYYRKRTDGARKTGWSTSTSEYISKPRRPGLIRDLKLQGFECK